MEHGAEEGLQPLQDHQALGHCQLRKPTLLQRINLSENGTRPHFRGS